MADFKTIFLERFEEGIKNGTIRSVLDLGSGRSLNFLPLLEKYPELTYVGVEPSQSDAEEAKRVLLKFKNAEVHNALAYEPAGNKWGSFDLVVSLSVLEHVKQLEKFIKNSAAAARSGGQIVHRWDLGHALSPSSFKERFQVFLGDHVPNVLPENKFVCGIRPSKVRVLMEECGIRVEEATYHQMPGMKKLFKLLPNAPAELIRQAVAWEYAVSPLLESIEETKRLKLFPAVALWGRKN